MLLSSTGTFTKISSLPFAEKFSFFDVNQTLALEMNELCDIEVLVGFGGSVAGQGLGIIMSFAPRSIVLIGQDLVYESGARYSTDLHIEDDIGLGSDTTRYELLAQDGTNKYTSSDLKIFHADIEVLASKMRKNAPFRTNLINASTGGAIIEGFEHMSLLEFVQHFPPGEVHKTSKMNDELFQLIAQKPAVETYLAKRKGQVKLALSLLETNLNRLHESEISNGNSSACSKSEADLRDIVNESILLQTYDWPASWRLKENAHEKSELINKLKFEQQLSLKKLLENWQLML